MKKSKESAAERAVRIEKIVDDIVNAVPVTDRVRPANVIPIAVLVKMKNRRSEKKEGE